MATTSVAPKRIGAETLASLLLANSSSDSQPSPQKIAVIDVRGDDHAGGHIRSSINAPSGTLDYRMPELIRTLADKEMVVFHCALSQERGPRAARWYLEEKEKANKKMMALKDRAKNSDEQPVEGHTKEEAAGKKERDTREKEQEVFVLDQGFVGWQVKYGTDERLTEAYAPDIWADY